MPLSTTRFSSVNISALTAILFMAAFMLANALGFAEGAQRLAIIERATHLDIPQRVADINELLWEMRYLADHGNAAEVQKNFSGLMADVEEKLRLLKSSIPSGQFGAEITDHFEAIEETLKKERALYAAPYSSIRGRLAALNPVMADLNFHFSRAALWALRKHHAVVSAALKRLQEREKFLHISGVAFVTLGCLAIIFLVLDLYKRDELLMKARQAERLKSSFFAMMSHEIRTPINAILGMLTLIMDSALSRPQAQMAAMAKSSAESLLSIVNDVLDYSKIEAGRLNLELADFSLRDLIHNIVATMLPQAQQKGLTLLYTVASDLPEAIYADPARLRQILLNFLSNAVKFTDHGSIEVNVLPGALSPTNGASIRFNVVDTGIGIASEEQVLLFREFSQVDGSLKRRFSGTGLGLAICARLTNCMKGALGVTSEKGKGSTFWFSIPLQTAKGPVESRAVTSAAVCRLASILVVEDNYANQLITTGFLRSAGHHVDVAENGELALKRIQQKAYDLVFMDVSMPVMDGLDATRAIRALGGPYKNIPILAMTAHALRGDRSECLKAGMNGYISKPATRESLLQAVQHWASAAQDPILSCVESVGIPGRNPDGSKVVPMARETCENDAVFPYEFQQIEEASIRRLYKDLGKRSFHEYEKVFRADVGKLGAAINIAAEMQDWIAVRLHVHSLKSSVLNFGMTTLSALAETIEQQCKTQGRPNVELLQRFSHAQNSALEHLDKKLGEMRLSSH